MKNIRFVFSKHLLIKYGGIFLFLADLLFITIINAYSIIPFFYFFLLTIIIYAVCFRKWSSEVIYIFAFYSFLTICLYLLQYYSLPSYFGFSGGLGIGTDDSFYYSQVADTLPAGFPLRSGPSFYVMHHFSFLLEYLNPFQINHPFDIIFANTMAATFVPIFTREVANYLSGNKEVGYYAFLFSLIGPFLMANSLILVRDGWTATLLIASIYFLLKNRWLLLLIGLTLLFYIRLASGAIDLPVLCFFLLKKYKIENINLYEKIFKYSLGILVGGVLVFYLTPVIKEYLISKGFGNFLFRENFIVNKVGRGGGDASLLSKLLLQPFYIRLPVGTAFFTLTPLLSFSSIVKEGIFIPRNLLSGLFYPLLFLFYLKYLIMFVAHKKNNADYIFYHLLLLFIFLMVVLSQISLQYRHKVMFMPLFYLVVGYAYSKYRKIKHSWASLMVLFYFLLVIVFRIVV